MSKKSSLPTQAPASSTAPAAHSMTVAKLVSAHTQMPSAFGFMHGTVLDQDDIVAPDFDSWGSQ